MDAERKSVATRASLEFSLYRGEGCSFSCTKPEKETGGG